MNLRKVEYIFKNKYSYLKVIGTCMTIEDFDKLFNYIGFIQEGINCLGLYSYDIQQEDINMIGQLLELKIINFEK